MSEPPKNVKVWSKRFASYWRANDGVRTGVFDREIAQAMIKRCKLDHVLELHDTDEPLTSIEPAKKELEPYAND